MIEDIGQVDHSFFRTEARDNGSLTLTAIGATIDHGDAEDITGFVMAYLDDETEVDPINAPGVTMQMLLVGGEMEWTSEGIITLLLTDDADNPLKQAVLQQFLTLSMISGRFRPDEDTQKHIYADATTGDAAANPTCPALWWDALDAAVLSVLADSEWNTTYAPGGGAPWTASEAHFIEWVTRYSGGEFIPMMS
jgi:hypothetical protein